MNSFTEASPEERAMIPNVMQESPRNNIKREEIDNKRVIHTLKINNRDKYQSSLREEPRYTMYWVHKTRQDIMMTKMRISPSYI